MKVSEVQYDPKLIFWADIRPKQYWYWSIYSHRGCEKLVRLACDIAVFPVHKALKLAGKTENHRLSATIL